MDKQTVEEILELELPVNGDGRCRFKLEQVVCNHGFFMMAPNRWMPETKTLHRPLRLLDHSSSVMVSVSHSNDKSLAVHVNYSSNLHLSDDDKQAILVQVKRMLRLSSKEDNAVKEFQALHPKALETGFGRLFRAPTLFEDVVKCILLCSTSFSRTLLMARRLCKLQNLVSRGKFKCSSSTELDKEGIAMGNFPNAQEVVRIGKKMLGTACKLGYRENTIYQFAKRVTEGKINLDDEEEEGFQDNLWKKLMKIKGVGPFVCQSVMMCIGAYNVIPQDSETLRHLQEVHGKRSCRNLRAAKRITKEIYEPYKPFQCLAFWLEMVESYERVFGKLSELPESEYGNVGGYGTIEKQASERDDD